MFNHIEFKKHRQTIDPSTKRKLLKNKLMFFKENKLKSFCRFCKNSISLKSYFKKAEEIFSN